MGERRSTTRSRILGTELARIRKAAGLDAKVLAEKLGWPGSKLSRIEQGKQGIEDIELVALLSICDALADNMTRLITLSRESNQDSWLQMYETRTRTLTPELERATTITNYECNLVPGLLQTKAYMRALSNSTNDELVALRTARQELLRGVHAPLATFLIEESVLRRPVGGQVVMHDQLMHLVFLTGWKCVSIRVLPTAVGMHAGVDSPFLMLGNKERKPLVVVATKVANVFLEGYAQVATYEAMTKELDGLALSEEQSRVFITRVADEFGRPREEHDGEPPGDLAQEQPQQ